MRFAIGLSDGNTVIFKGKVCRHVLWHGEVHRYSRHRMIRRIRVAVSCTLSLLFVTTCCAGMFRVTCALLASGAILTIFVSLLPYVVSLGPVEHPKPCP